MINLPTPPATPWQDSIRSALDSEDICVQAHYLCTGLASFLREHAKSVAIHDAKKVGSAWISGGRSPFELMGGGRR